MLFKPKRKTIDLVQEWLASGHKTANWLSPKRWQAARDFLQEPSPKSPLSELATTFLASIRKHLRRKSRKYCGLFLIILLMGTALVGYFLVREIQLKASLALIRDCEGKNPCPGLIEALERLVKADRSWPSDNNFSSSHLAGAELAGANFYNANLANANLSHSYLFQANFSSAYLFQANLENANLLQANLKSAYLEQANLFQANLQQADLDRASLLQANLELANLDRAHLFQANLQQADLDRTNLYGAYLVRTNLNSANFRGANLHLANLNSANLHLANLNSANLHSTNLIESQNLTPSQIKSACNWSQAFYKGNWNQAQWKWIVDRPANQQYIEQLQQDQASEPEQPVDCSRWGTEQLKQLKLVLF